MVSFCPKCSNREWNKHVENDTIKCPICGTTWKFTPMPLLMLTGCSGVGKTTTAMEIMRRNVDFVVLDGDIFYDFMKIETVEDNIKWVESMGNISKNIMQSGRPVMWAMAGNIDKISETYHSRFFSEIRCLALVCDEELLRTRMTVGRGITDEKWITSSVKYNHYFKTHNQIGRTNFETFDISNKSISEVADYVIKWVHNICKY